MQVGLVDIDGKMPNLVLMKLSAWHKLQGDDVELTTPVFAPIYDRVYASQVFTWSLTPSMEGVQIGGTGVDLKTTLPDDVEAMCPDYSLYKMDYSMGFLTRGCIRKCPFCFVPEKEGKIRPAADIEDFLRHKKAVLLDNNVLAHEHGIRQIEKIAGLGIRVDFNQGLDARLIDVGIAKLLNRVKWDRYIRIACDSVSMMAAVEKAVNKLRSAGYGREIFCYMLVKDVDEAHDRAEFLRGLNVTPFAQPYRDPNGAEPPRRAKDFARWVNHRAIFKTVRWEEYNVSKIQ